jgi:hypothetical protein
LKVSQGDIAPPQLESFYPLLPGWAQQEYRVMVNDNIHYLEGLARGEFLTVERQLDVSRWTVLAEQTAKVCNELLRQLSPDVALTPTWLQLPDDLLAMVGDYGSLNRFRWVLAAIATGHHTDIDLLANYLRRAGRWWGARTVLDRYKDHGPDLLLSVDGAPGREFLHRTSSQVIRFHWAAEMIALEIGRQVEADPQFATHLKDFTERNVRGCIDTARYYSQLLDGPPIPLYAPGMALAKHMSIWAGEEKMTFTQAATSIKLEARPWVLWPPLTNIFVPPMYAPRRSTRESCSNA